MHEIQAVDPRDDRGAGPSRRAEVAHGADRCSPGCPKKEGELVERTEHLLALVEETEFGIALPTALRVLGARDEGVEEWLKEGDASPRTVALEKRIEDDLLGLLEAMRRLPPTTPPPPGSPLPSDLRDRERELNRLVAELKMIRLLQSRLNDDTVGVDETRPEAPALPPALRREIEALKKQPGRDPRLPRADRGTAGAPRRRSPTRERPEIVRLTDDHLDSDDHYSSKP